MFNFCPVHHLSLFILFRWDVMCLQWQKRKKKFTDLNLKEIRDEADKRKIELELFSAHYQTHGGDFFCLFEIETWKPMYPMMLKSNVCIAQCLLVGYYKSSDQSNKVVQFSTTEKCRPLLKWWDCLVICILVIMTEVDQNFRNWSL